MSSRRGPTAKPRPSNRARNATSRTSCCRRRAQVGASGVAISGSPAEVLTANARQGQLDIKAIQYGSQLRQNSLTTQAAISRFSGKQAVAASIFRAGGNLVSGLSGIYDPSKAVTFGKSAFPPAPGGGLY